MQQYKDTKKQTTITIIGLNFVDFENFDQIRKNPQNVILQKFWKKGMIHKIFQFQALTFKQAYTST